MAATLEGSSLTTTQPRNIFIRSGKSNKLIRSCVVPPASGRAMYRNGGLHRRVHSAQRQIPRFRVAVSVTDLFSIQPTQKRDPATEGPGSPIGHRVGTRCVTRKLPPPLELRRLICQPNLPAHPAHKLRALHRTKHVPPAEDR